MQEEPKGLAQAFHQIGKDFIGNSPVAIEGLDEAVGFVEETEQHQKREIACLEEIAFLKGWIGREGIKEILKELGDAQYGRYLKNVLDGKYIDELY